MGFKKKNKSEARTRKHRSIRKKIMGTSDRPRLAIFRSSKNIYAQLIDDVNEKTITAVSTRNALLKDQISSADGKIAKAKIIGTAIAEKAKDLKIENVVFDRGGYLYHGRVKALADAAREGGLKF
ncbi:MAG: 50S ribosomal protein L18 [Deferribacteres bacterium]|nr:50S ribosomal protein L18 [candidate division KSB1 bacterium]MCB9502651.1 50S ribosomal protein L18 [Deferribacteres bacterium]